MTNKEWIKTSDCKPPIYKDVIITGKKKYKYEKNYDYFVDVAVRTPDGKYLMFNDNYEGEEEFDIIAWQYMPEPYIESEV